MNLAAGAGKMATVTGRFDCAVSAEEAFTESRLRFPAEDLSIVPGSSRAAEALVVIRVADATARMLAVRTLRGRGAHAVEVASSAARDACGPEGLQVMLPTATAQRC